MKGDEEVPCVLGKAAARPRAPGLLQWHFCCLSPVHSSPAFPASRGNTSRTISQKQKPASSTPCSNPWVPLPRQSSQDKVHALRCSFSGAPRPLQPALLPSPPMEQRSTFPASTPFHAALPPLAVFCLECFCLSNTQPGGLLLWGALQDHSRPG